MSGDRAARRPRPPGGPRRPAVASGPWPRPGARNAAAAASRWRAAWLVCVVVALLGAAVGPARAAPPLITAIDLAGPHRLPEDRVRATIGLHPGEPRWRGAVRDSLARLWGLGLFSGVRVEEVPEAGGVRLRYELVLRAHVARVDYRGDLGLPEVDLAAVAGLGLGDGAEPERLARARRDLLALYERSGYRQARVDVETAADPITNAVTVVFWLRAGDQARIGTLDVRGVHRASLEGIGKALGFEPGDRYRQEAVRRGTEAAEKWLRGQGFPAATVTAAPPAAPPGADRVDLLVTVVEGPRLSLEVEGAGHPSWVRPWDRSIGEAAIRERLTFDQAGVVDEAELQASLRQVEVLYRERGHHFAVVTGSLARDGGDAAVRIRVLEGPRVTVESVEIAGGEAVRGLHLEERMATHPGTLVRARPFVQETLDRDVRLLEGYLRGLGYVEAAVGPARVRFADDWRHARIVVPVEEGPRVRVDGVALSGITVLPEGELRAALPVKPGRPWSAAEVEEGRRVIERQYARRGYQGADVAAETTRHGETVGVAYTVREGHPTRIGRVIIRGLVLTREHVVRRELPFAPGDLLDPDRLIQAQRDLTALGLFEKVEVEPLRPPSLASVDVVITVREGKPWHLDVGLGYSTFEGARGLVEIGHDNLFGTARGLRLRLRASQRGDREELIYREPWFLGTRWLAEAGIFRERREEIGFDLEEVGLALGVQRDLFPHRIHGLHGSLRYEISQVERFDVDRTLAAEDIVEGRERLATITPELTLDRRDRPLDPRRGSFHLASVELGEQILGGDADYVKARLETSWFLDWFPPTVVALSARVGVAAPFAGTPAIPAERRFFAGGSTTVRGYRERRLGPVDSRGNPAGGQGLVVLNAEWRFPLWRWIGGAVFFDAGAVTERVEDLEPGAFVSGVGFGIRVTTPVGPVRIDVGYPLDRVPHQDQVPRYYLSVGYPF